MVPDSARCCRSFKPAAPSDGLIELVGMTNTYRGAMMQGKCLGARRPKQLSVPPVTVWHRALSGTVSNRYGAMLAQRSPSAQGLRAAPERTHGAAMRSLARSEGVGGALDIERRFGTGAVRLGQGRRVKLAFLAAASDCEYVQVRIPSGNADRPATASK